MIKNNFLKSGYICFFNKVYVSVFSFVSIFFFVLGQNPVFVLIFILSAILHEVAHIIFMKANRVRIKRVFIFPLGCDIVCDTGRLSYKRELIITLSGSFANLLFFTLSFFILKLYPSRLLLFFAVCNLFLGVINLIPLSFFDGGKALRLILYDCLEIDRAFYLHFSFDIFASVIFFVFSLFLILYSDFNFSVSLVTLYASLSVIFGAIKSSYFSFGEK